MCISMRAMEPAAKGGVRPHLNVMVPMRDGLSLATDVYRPERQSGPLPVLLMRTPYGKAIRAHLAERHTAGGYVVAIQDVRGRGDSEGTFRPLFQEPEDGYDTIEWLARQPWCTGEVGTFGGSYEGWAQWAAAKAGPPSLKAMAVSVTAGKTGRQEIWHQGTLLLTTLNWLTAVSGRVVQPTWVSDWKAAFEHLPVSEMPTVLGRDLPLWQEWLEHPGLDDYWRPILLDETDFQRIDIPVMHVSGWYDGSLWATAWFYEQMRSHSPAAQRQTLVLGPWDHSSAAMERSARSYGGHDFGPEAEVDLGGERLRWFDRWLKADSQVVAPASRVFVTGVDRWASAEHWAEPPRPLSLHVQAEGGLAEEPAACPGADAYDYDPAKPLVLYDNWDIYGSATNADVARREELRLAPDVTERPDVLTYTSAQLSEAVTVMGNPVLHLWAETDGADTDWFAWLQDVGPDGEVLQTAQGQLRARFHRSLEREELLEPGRTYCFRVELSPTAHCFAAEHRVRLMVSSSNFPRYDRNLNTGGRLGFESEGRVARNTLRFGPEHPTRLDLPVRADARR